jgi:carboxymethylenebutenolidase
MARPPRRKASDFDPEVLKLFDQYVHGAIDRRGFLAGAARFAVGAAGAAGLLAALAPNFAAAQKVAPEDKRLSAEFVEFPSPEGHGTGRGYLVRSADAKGPLPLVLVVHENRGLNPHIRDVARRAAKAGYAAFAPDALYPLGGYPGNDDDGRSLQAQRAAPEMIEDFMAAAEFLRDHEATNGRIACTGFCFGGAVTNIMAVRQPWLKASVPYYGGWPPVEDAVKVEVPLQIHLAGDDERVNAGWPAYEAALKAAGKPYEVFIYEGCQHGFHNDTTPRFNPEAAALAWSRTLDFFARHLA